MMHNESSMSGSMSGRLVRLLALMVAVVLLAAACGDDDGDGDADEPSSDAAVVDDSADGSTADAGADDEATADDATEDDPVADDPVAEDPVAEDPAPAPAAGTLDCAELQEAFNTIGDAIELNPAVAPDPAELEASFVASQGQLAALAEAAPELAGEVATVQDGLVELSAAFAGIGWDTSALSDSSTALEFSAEVLPVISTLFGPLTSIQGYISTSCA